MAVPIDWQTVELVWDDSDGYPADGRYRDYHRPHDPRPEALEQRRRARTTTRPRAALAARARARLRRARARLDAYG